MRVRTIAAGLFLAGLLPASLAAQAEVKELVRRLGDDNYLTSREASLELRRTRPSAALPLLAAALPEYSLHGQNLALSIVQSYPRNLAEPIFRRLLEGSSPHVVLAAGVYLYVRGDRSVAGKIVAALHKPTSKQVLVSMLNRVRAIRDEAVAAAVFTHVKRDAGIVVLGTALDHALIVQYRPAVAVVYKLLAEPDRLKVEERAICAAFLVAMGEQGDNKLLAAAIRADTNFSRVLDFLNRAPAVDREVLAAVLDSIEGKRGYRVGSALRVLARHDYGPAVRKMRGLLDHDDVQVSKAAFDSLMQMGTGLDSKFLRSLLASARTHVAIAAADTLRRLDDHAGLSKLIEFVNQPGRDRPAAVEALGKFREPRAVSILIDLLEDKDRNIRSRAQRGLQRILRGMFPYRALDLAATGYLVGGGSAQRRKAVAKIRSWWSSRGGKK